MNKNCDPFWSEMNGGVCSDASGFMLKPDGSAASWSETLNWANTQVGIKPGPASAGNLLQTYSGPLMIGAAVILFLIAVGGRRR